MLGYEEALPCLKSAQEVFEAEHKLKTLKNESAQQEQSKTTSQASLIQKTSGNIASESLHAEGKTNQEKYSKDEQGAEVGKSSTSSSSSSSDEQTSSDSDEEEADDSSSQSHSSSSSSSNKTNLSTREERIKKAERKLELAIDKGKKQKL